MNRVATWILATISGVLIAFGALGAPLLGASYGVSASCVSTNGPCTPVTDQLIVSLPPWQGGFFAFAAMTLLLGVLIGLPAWIATPILAARRGASARTPLLVVSIIATALLLVGVILPVWNIVTINAPQVCINGTGGGGQPQWCYTGAPGFLMAMLGLAAPLIALALVVGMPAWVMALTQTARGRQWGWFTAVLLFSPIAALLYAFFGLPRPPATSAPTSPAPQEPAPAI